MIVGELSRFENYQNVEMTALGFAVTRGPLLHQKTDFSLLRLRRSHELPNRIEDGLDLLVVGTDFTF